MRQLDIQRVVDRVAVRLAADMERRLNHVDAHDRLADRAPGRILRVQDAIRAGKARVFGRSIRSTRAAYR